MFGITPFKYLPRSIQTILLLNVGVFLISFLFGRNISSYILYYGAFIPSQAYELWRFLSYAFVHLNFMHIAFNMLMFWMFAYEVCKTIGERHFVALYLVSAIFASVFTLPLYSFGIMGNNPVIGASGALYGVMVAYAVLFPERIILLFFIIPMKIKHAILLFIAIDFFMANSGDGIARYTHLSGMLAGYLFMLFLNGKPIFKPYKKQKIYSKEFFKKQAKQQEQQGSDYSKNNPLEGVLYKGNSNTKEERLNEILEKINRSGLQSLTQEERDYLQWFGQQNKNRS